MNRALGRDGNPSSASDAGQVRIPTERGYVESLSDTPDAIGVALLEARAIILHSHSLDQHSAIGDAR